MSTGLTQTGHAPWGAHSTVAQTTLAGGPQVSAPTPWPRPLPPLQYWDSGEAAPFALSLTQGVNGDGAVLPVTVKRFLHESG